MREKIILLVDDEKDAVEVLKRRLEREGYKVWVADDGLQALEKAKEHPSLILLDIMLPGINGFEVLHKLRNVMDTKYIPVIMISAKAESKSVFEAQDLGATDYIIKPFELKELLDLIKKHIT
jgi:DNA-binding response OmpR family regulator